MAITGATTKRTVQIVAFAALFAASVYGIVGSAAGLAQAPAVSPYYLSVALR